MKKLILMATALVAICGCSKNTSDDSADRGERFALDFSITTPGANNVAGTRADAGNENLELQSHISMSVFEGDGTVANFIDSRYVVGDKDGKRGLIFNNNIPTTAPGRERQRIIEVVPETYTVYGVGVNDGYSEMVQTLATPNETLSTYATENGKEYIHATATQTVLGNDATTRQVKLSFKRQVAMVRFSVVGATGVNLPSVSTENQVVKSPKMQHPVGDVNNPLEGIMNLKDGITLPLSGRIDNEPLKAIYANEVGAAFGMYYYVLPTDVLTNPLTYDVQFTLAVDDGNGVVADRVFDIVNVPLPVMGNGNRGFEKGKLYSYTVTVSNTGLYISEVQVENWVTQDQGGITAQ